MPVGMGPDDCWHRDAWLSSVTYSVGLPVGLPDGTYELVGPKVQSNPEKFAKHTLVPHGADRARVDPPRDFIGLRNFFGDHDIEGLVWHHADGRMVKIKAKDFGLERGSGIFLLYPMENK